MILLAKCSDPNDLDVKDLNLYGLTPLYVAAIGYPNPYNNGSQTGPNEPVLRHFVKRADTSLLEKIDALELAGSLTLLNGSSTPKALGYWDEAQDLRESAQGSIPKVPWKVNGMVPWRAVEWTTRDELRELRHRPFSEKKIQALLVGRRILSRVSFKAFVHHLWKGSFMVYCNGPLSANRYTEFFDICWIFLEGARGHADYDYEVGLMIAEITISLEDAIRKLKNKHKPFLTLEIWKLSLDLVFETNIRIFQPIDPTNAICSLVAMLSESPEMVTHEIKRCLHQFVKRDGRNR